MIKSMTGFGRSELVDNDKKISVEMKSVNHRYLDVTIKMPRKLNKFEANLKQVLKEYAERGKMDIYIGYENLKSAGVAVRYNSEIAREYMQYLTEMGQEFGLTEEIKPTVLARFPEVLTIEDAMDEDDEALYRDLEKVFREALENFTAARVAEGENLKKDLLEKVDRLAFLVDRVEELLPEIVESYKKRLLEKSKEFLQNSTIDENRIAAEVTIYSDKICVDEEMVRLKSHIAQVRKMLGQDGQEGIGRKLDFIVQEMNREANTIGSKANDVEIARRVLEIKAEIEKIREQIQNIE